MCFSLNTFFFKIFVASTAPFLSKSLQYQNFRQSCWLGNVPDELQVKRFDSLLFSRLGYFTMRGWMALKFTIPINAAINNVFKITFIVLIKMPQNEKRSYSGFRLLLPSYVHQAWFLLKLLMKFSCKLCIMLRKNERDKKIASSCQKSLLNKCTTSNYTKRIMSSSAFVNFRNDRNWKNIVIIRIKNNPSLHAYVKWKEAFSNQVVTLKDVWV